jgi:hypothetical protein
VVVTYDQRAVRVIIYTLCIIAVLGALTVFYLALKQLKVDPFTASVVTGTIALLTPSPLSKSKRDEPQPVEVVNEAEDPVPTEDV